MKPEEQNLILRAAELAADLTANEPDAWRRYDHEDWQEEMDHGPRYLVSDWFGPLRERDRVRYRRAIDNLEAAGLVTTWRAEGTRLTHVGLTEAGMELAKSLAAELTAAPANEATDG